MLSASRKELPWKSASIRSPKTPPTCSTAAICRSPAERLKDLLEEIELADQVGLDFYGLGEHHRPDFVASAPVTILAAAAARTKNIRLSTAVTVLSSDDPIRVWQQFATLDLLSNGRAEIMAGRGSFIESFPLFGYDLNDYDELFEEKLAGAARDPQGRQGQLARLDAHQADPRHRDLPQARSRTRCRSGSPSAARPIRSPAPPISRCR